MQFELSKFDEYKEDNRREVKRASGGLPASLWETYSSFANSYGGAILLGVSESEDGSWKATGLIDGRKLLKEFWDTVHNPKKVSLNLLSDSDVTLYDDAAGHVILAIHVPMAKRDQRPIFINDDIWGGTFRRNYEGDYHCSKSEVRAMLRDETEETMDMKVIENLTVADLNAESVHGYRNRHRSMKPGHPWNNLDDEDYLQMIGAATVAEDGKAHPTAAGLLMFGDEYRIVREFPEYFLDYREMLDPSIRWTDRLYSSTGDWSGNLFDFYFRACNKLVKDLKMPFKMEGIFRVDDTPAHKAIREVLANCLVNTDYYIPRGVVIRKEPDCLILENPGSIRVGKYQMRKGGESDPRNKTLMKMFNLIDIGERAGSGIPELYAVWEQEGWEEPTIEERFGDAARTILTLPLKEKTISGGNLVSEKNDTKKVTLKMQETCAKIYGRMEIGTPYKIDELAAFVGLKRTRTKELAKWMVSEGMITEKGTVRDKRYIRPA